MKFKHVIVALSAISLSAGASLALAQAKPEEIGRAHV